QLVDLGDRESAVVGDEERLRALQPLGQLLDDPFLVLLQHVLSPEMTRARRNEPWETDVLGLTSAGLLRLAPPAVFGENESKLGRNCSGFLRELLDDSAGARRV